MNRDRPRILHLGKYYPPHRGGIESYLQTLCETMQDRVDATVVVANDGARTTRTKEAGVTVIRVGTLACVASTPICPSMALISRRVPADIVHIHMPNPVAVATYLACLSSLPLVISWHSDIVRQRTLGKLVGPMIEQALKRAAAVICASPQYAASSPALRRHGQRCRVIPYGIQPEHARVADEEEVANIRQRYGPKIILSVGRLVYYKGFEYLISAMSRVDARLIIIGDGPLNGTLQSLAVSHGVADRVTVLTKVADVRPYYQAADVFVLASTERSEAFGIVQLEAMACGKPVVNTQLESGVPFVSRHGVSGLTVEPRDSNALASALTLLLARDDLRARYGAGARRLVDEEFTARTMTDETAALYNEIITSEARRSGTDRLRRVQQ